jgi:hypothetical protein
LPDSTPATLTATGINDCAVELLPSWPFVFNPQQAAMPEAMAQVKFAPLDSDVTVLPDNMPAVLTATGIDDCVTELLPSWPLVLDPQQ